MSHLEDYELEDIVWELGDNDDHIVPYPGDTKVGYAVKRDNSKRPRCTETNAENRICSDNITGRTGDESVIALKEDKETMMEKSSWTHSSNGGFPASLNGDAKRKNLCSASDDERTPTPCLSSISIKSADNEFCADDTVLGDHTFVADSNLKRYQLNQSSRTENDLSFFGDDLQDKSSNDLLFYGWPELENFEDVDDMFRNCDSTFGLDIDNSDDLSWFPSSHVIEGSNDALKSSFDFSSCNPRGLDTITEEQEVYGQSNDGMVVNKSDNDFTPVSCKRDLHKLVPDIHHFDTQLEIHSHVSPSKHQKSSEGKRRDHSLGSSFIQLDKLSEAGESSHLLDPQHSFSLDNHQQGEINHQPCLESPMPMIEADNNHPSNQVLPRSATSMIKSEVSNLPTISPRGSSQASNHMHSVQSSHDVSFNNPTCSENKKKSKLHQRRLSRHRENSILVAGRADSDLVCAKKQSPGVESEAEGQSEVDGCDNGFVGELGGSAIQESSCTSSALDEVSVDARSLKQLQRAMVQLDMRTKLCIRDSLYRLARSAAQRHDCVNQSSAEGDDKDATGALLSDETNKCTGFIDMETDTNPIDRSIAHLLFHRPSDPSAVAAPVDAVALKSHSMVQPLNRMTADEAVGREETGFVNEEATEQRS